MENSKAFDAKKEKVFLFPSQTEINGMNITFLFSLYQVEDVITKADVYTVPLAEGNAKGIAYWKNHIVPVIFLDKHLGLTSIRNKNTQKMLIVKAVDKNDYLYGIIEIPDKLEIADIPDLYVQSLPEKYIPRDDLVLGMYKKEKELIVIVDLKKILNGK